MADVIWPSLLRPTSGGLPTPAFANVKGPTSYDGLAQVVGTDAGYWTLMMGGVLLYGADRLRAWNATALKLNGQVGTCLIPVDVARFMQPFPVFYKQKQRRPRRGANSPGGALILAGSENGIPEGTVAIQIRQRQGQQIQEGTFFSTGERLYAVQNITSVTKASNGDRIIAGTIWPPAREDIFSGTNCEFDNPVFRARLATDGEMKVATDLIAMGSADVNWVEDK